MTVIMFGECVCYFFFFNDTATTEIYTLSLHDALPIFDAAKAIMTTDTFPKVATRTAKLGEVTVTLNGIAKGAGDRKSTRLNSSHANISYAVFCLKKKRTTAVGYRCFLLVVLLHP